MVDDALVEIFTAKKGIAVGRLDLEYAFADFEDGNIECPAAEVVDGDLASAFLLKPVGERGGGGLVDDAKDLKPGDAAGVLGRLTLRVIKIS